MSLQYMLETQESSAGGKRALIVIPEDERQEELICNIDTFQGISISPERADLKKEQLREKIEARLERAEQIGDTTAIEKLRNELRFSGGEHISDQIIKYVNMFFSLIPEEDCDIFYKYIYDAQTIIHSLTVDNNGDVARDLTEKTTAMTEEIDLGSKLIKFTEFVKPPLPDGSEIGNATHHSASKTFDKIDYLEMTALAFYAKLLFPIWGQYCHKMKTIGIGSIDKEFFCLQICEQGLDQSALSRVYNKFKYYVYNNVRQELDKTTQNSYGDDSNFSKNEFILSKNGYDVSRFQFLQLSKLIIKRLATFNTQVSSLRGEDNIPNIMIYLQAIIKNNVANTLNQFNKRSGLLTRNEPKGTEEDNFTFMENCSRISKFTPDHPIYTRKGMELSLPKLIKEQGLNLDHYNEIVEFYHGDNLPMRNLFTDSILSIYLFPIIGGSVNLNHLQARQYIMGMAYSQLRLLSQDKGYGISLAQMLSSKTSSEPRENKIDPVTAYIRAMSDKSQEYKDLMTRYPHSCEAVQFNEAIIGTRTRGEKREKLKGTINIAEHIALIKDWIVDYDHYVNFCPVLWSYFPNRGINSRQKQNDILQFSEHIVEDYYEFILDVCHAVAMPDKNRAFWEEMGFTK